MKSSATTQPPDLPGQTFWCVVFHATLKSEAACPHEHAPAREQVLESEARAVMKHLANSETAG